MKRAEMVKLLTNNDELLRQQEWLHQNASYVANGDIVLQKLYNAADRNVDGAWRALRSLKAQAIGPFFEEAISAPWETAEQLIRKIDTVEQDLLRILQEFPGDEVHHLNAVSSTDVYPREWHFKDVLQVGAHIEAMGGHSGITSQGTMSLSKPGHRTGPLSAHTNLRALNKNLDLPPKNLTSTWKNVGEDIATTGGKMLPASGPTKYGIYWDDDLIDKTTGQFKPNVTPQRAAEAMMPAAVEPQEFIAKVAYGRPSEVMSRRALRQAVSPPGTYNPKDLEQRGFTKEIARGLKMNKRTLRDNLDNLSSKLRINNPSINLPWELQEPIHNISDEALRGEHSRTTLAKNPKVLDLRQRMEPWRLGGGSLGVTPFLGKIGDIMPSPETGEALHTGNYLKAGINYGKDLAIGGGGAALSKLKPVTMAAQKLASTPLLRSAAGSLAGKAAASWIPPVAAGLLINDAVNFADAASGYTLKPAIEKAGRAMPAGSGRRGMPSQQEMDELAAQRRREAQERNMAQRRLALEANRRLAETKTFR